MFVTHATNHDNATVWPEATEYMDMFVTNSWMNNTTGNVLKHNSSLQEDICSDGLPELLNSRCTLMSTFKTVTSVATFCTLAISFFGNSLILISLCRFRKQFKGSLYMFIGNLAVSDMFLATGMSLHILEVLCPALNLSGNIWYCFVKLSITVTSYTESGITLMFMSLDRFCAIAYPMRHFLRHIQRRRIWRTIACTWIVSLLLGFLTSMAIYMKHMKLKQVCIYGICVPRGSTVGVVVFLLFQILVNSVLCGLVVWKVKVNSKSATRNKQISIKAKTRLLVKVYVLFAVCWFPFIVVSIALELDLELEKRRKLLCTRDYMIQLGMVNSCLNWMLYGLTNVKFRKAFKLVLCNRNQTETRSSIALT